MSAQAKLDELMSHPETIACAGRWVTALDQGVEGTFWRELTRRSAPITCPVEDEPLCEELNWGRLRQRGQGKMFGLLCASDQQGRLCYLRAYSGQLQGAWLRAGWAPPLFEPSEVAFDSLETQTELHLINRLIDEGRGELSALKRARRATSRALTVKLISSRLLRRRVEGRLESLSLSALWSSAPLGAGDCCAPKLLCWAASLELRPLGLVEFWWGAPQGAHRSGARYAPCQERCAPLLPWLLGER